MNFWGNFKTEKIKINHNIRTRWKSYATYRKNI